MSYNSMGGSGPTNGEPQVHAGQQQQRQSFTGSTVSIQPFNNRRNSGVGRDRLQPEKEPVEFETIHLQGAPAEVELLVNNMKSVARQFLYHWRTFPIILPPPLSLAPETAGEHQETLTRRKHHLRDLFIAPSFDELDAVAIDREGEPRRLTAKQLECIKERGEFEVESLNFPGQVHRWRLSALLQRGIDRRHESLLNDLALATRFIIVTAKARLVSHCFSVSESLKATLTGVLRLIDILIGLPSLQAQNLDVKLREERRRHLVAELICKPEYDDALELLCAAIRRQLQRIMAERFELNSESQQMLPVSVPYVFGTPSGASVDLRLFNKDLIKKALPTLVAILERETRGWFLHFREKLISELRAQKKPDDEIEREVNEAVMQEYLQRVYNSILSHPDIQALGNGIGHLLVQQAQSVVLMHRAVENVQKKLAHTKETLRKRVECEHPVLSRIGPWMRDQMREAEARFIEDCQWSAHEEALALCSGQSLHQTVYFLNRDLTFMREREHVLLKELRKVKTPTRCFHWPVQIWFPKNWTVRRCFQGHSEVIPTVLSRTPTTITTPRADPSQPIFIVSREVVHSTTTRWPTWRWINYLIRTWCWTWNAMFLFGIAIPYSSSVSFRALLYTEPFTPDLELSQINGTLFPRKSSQTPTLCSRLTTLWRHISKSRTHFETEPDTGFIGKGMTRHANRLWNYGVKGFLGTLAIVFLFPLACVFISCASLFVAVTSFLWMPMVTLALYAFMALFVDMDSPDPIRNRYLVVTEALVWNIGIQGLLQPVAALTVAFVVCPVISLTILTVAVLRYCVRYVWDTTMFHLVIKKRGRIPAGDSFVVKRIAGPGMASDYYFQIKPEQALAAFEAKLEVDELLAYQQEIERLITQPQRDFTQFVEACFGPFAVTLDKTKEPYKTMEKEARDLISCLHDKLERRRLDLQTGLSVGIRSKIKLSAYDLKLVIQQGAMMLEKLYPSHVFARMPSVEDDYWENRGLAVGDWSGLSGLMFADVFSLDFLQPLDDADNRFRLEPHPLVNLRNYSDLINNTDLAGLNGPDLLGAVYAPRGNIQIHSPYLAVAAFNPRSNHSNTTRKSDKRNDTNGLLTNSRTPLRSFSEGLVDGQWKPWKRQMRPYSAEKLLIPLPVPHPAHIAVTIYNRDTEDPLPLDTELCQSILRAIEEAPGEMATENAVGRYRGGDSSFDSVASQSSISIDTTLNKVDELQEVENEVKDGETYHWTLSNWVGGMPRRRNNSGSVKVDLASPEDVTLDSDSTRVMFSTYGTTV